MVNMEWEEEKQQKREEGRRKLTTYKEMRNEGGIRNGYIKWIYLFIIRLQSLVTNLLI